MYKSIFLFILLFTGVSCKTIEPEAPAIEIQEELQLEEQKVSTIHIPIKVNLRPYFFETNASVPTEFKGKEKTCEGISYSYKYIRDSIQFKGIGDELEFNVDGKYALNLNYCPQCTEIFNSNGNCIIPRVYASCGVDEPMRKIFVSFNSQIGVTSDYKLTSNTILQKVKAKSPCKITVFNYNATETIEEEVTNALKAIETDIDKEISAIDLRPEMAETWTILSEPTNLEGFGFLHLQPQNVSIDTITYIGDTAYFNTVLEAYPNIYLAEKEIKSTELPTLSKYKKQDGFDITMDINAPYDSLSSIISNNISGITTEIKGREVIFKSVNVYGAKNRQISLQIEFGGKKKGTLYLLGTPSFNKELQHISFPDLEFDIKTKNALLKSAKWLFDKKLTRMVRESASIDLKPYLDTLKSSLNQNLNTELTEGVSMSGIVNDVLINSIVPRENELFLRVSSLGKLTIAM